LERPANGENSRPALVSRHRFDDAFDARDDVIEIEGTAFDFQFSGFDFGQIERVVDDFKYISEVDCIFSYSHLRPRCFFPSWPDRSTDNGVNRVLIS